MCTIVVVVQFVAACCISQWQKPGLNSATAGEEKKKIDNLRAQVLQ